LHWDFAAHRSTTRSTVTAVGGSVLVEEFLIAAPDQRRLLVLDAVAVADHQPAQNRTVDQDDLGRHLVYGDGLGVNRSVVMKIP
jgi:hypothetical protein